MTRVAVTIVSGGQTGVDRGALDAALALGVACGGWCPEGRKAEDGTLATRYPLQVLEGAGYADRTRRNVADSDGTLIISYNNPGRGTILTGRCAQGQGKPLLAIDAESLDAEAAVVRVRGFVRQNGIRVLNVAGPRATLAPGAYAYARQVIEGLLRSL